MNEAVGMQAQPPPTATWWQVIATSEPTVAELIADRLLSLGSPGVEIRDEAAETILLAGFPDESTARLADEAIRGLVIRSAMRPIDDDGLDRWREHAHPIRTDRFHLVPSWVPPLDDPDRIVIELDPGRSFGSGSHPTTRSCLDLLADSPQVTGRVLDVGTGSGVLAVAAALLGAETVEAIDVDPGSPAVVSANATRNRVSNRIRSSNRPLDRIVADEEPFDLVLANLLAPVVRELTGDLVRALAPGARIIVSGLLEHQRPEAAGRLVDEGLVPGPVVLSEGWCTMALDRPSSSLRGS